MQGACHEYVQENDPAANWSAEMKHVLNGLGKAAHHVGHPCAKLVEEIATTISCAIDFIVQVGVLRQLGQDAAGRVEADSSGGVLATVLLQASKLTPTANRSQSQALVPSNPGEEDVTALTNLSTDPVIERLIQSEELLQCVRIKAERFEASVEDAYQKLTTSTQNRHKGAAAYWRTGLADDAALDVVLKCAKEHIDDIDGDAAESEYDKLSEANLCLSLSCNHSSVLNRDSPTRMPYLTVQGFLGMVFRSWHSRRNKPQINGYWGTEAALSLMSHAATPKA